MSEANEPDQGEVNAPGIRVEVVRGGDPGDAVLAAVAAILTRPVVLPPLDHDQDADPHEARRAPARWQRAARLEGVAPGRRIATIAELVRHR